MSSSVTHPTGFGRGLVPRDYAQYPQTMFDPPSQMPLYPRSEWSQRIKEKVANKAQISDVLLAANIPSTDQNGHGYCWAYSVTGCVIAQRALANMPYARLNAHAVAAIIKKGRDEGGWCGLSAQFIRQYGVPTFDHWPEHSRDVKNDTPEMRANAALHRVTEEWVDIAQQPYDQNLTFEQMATCLLNNDPCALDFNHWSHSVLGCDLAETAASDLRNQFGKQMLTHDLRELTRIMDICGYGDSLFCPRIRNSWTDSWGQKGFGVLAGSKGIPNGALCVRVSKASMN
jgi:hypothetical protein